MFLDGWRHLSVMTMLVTTFAFFSDVTHGSNAVNLTSESGQPEVTLGDGKLVLGSLDTLGQRQVAAFLGIPYAEPPTGQLRFKKPVGLMSPGTAQFNATQYGPACFSHKPTAAQSEDCLSLNVWVPVNGSTQPPFAVIVWIHGGGFVMGSASQWPGDRLAAENDVIVVAMNYRLGPLGFLSTGDSASVGNYGLWDQHTALLWVQRNIAAFGGDPGAVTLMGESAGGKSVSFQVISPHSRNLFHRAIMQSGTAHCPTSLHWKPVESAQRLGRAVGCDHSAHASLINCLRDKSALDIANASSKVWYPDAVRTLIDFIWAPVHDGDFVPKLYDANGSALPISANTAFNGSVMIGVNNNEGAALKLWRIPAAAKFVADIEEKLLDPTYFRDNFLQGIMEQMFRSFPADSAFFRSAAEVVAYKFTDWTMEPPALRKADLYAMSGDQAYVSPAFQFLSQWLKGSPTRDQAYVYVFDNYPAVPAGEGMAGMKHEDDVYYTFDKVGERLRKFNASEAVITKETKLGENFRKMLTNYAKTGNPASPSAVPGWPEWPLYNLQNQTYLAISSAPRIASHYRAANVILWKDVVRKLPAYHKCKEPVKTPTSSSCVARGLTMTCLIALVISALSI